MEQDTNGAMAQTGSSLGTTTSSTTHCASTAGQGAQLQHVACTTFDLSMNGLIYGWTAQICKHYATHVIETFTRNAFLVSSLRCVGLRDQASVRILRNVARTAISAGTGTACSKQLGSHQHSMSGVEFIGCCTTGEQAWLRESEQAQSAPQFGSQLPIRAQRARLRIRSSVCPRHVTIANDDWDSDGPGSSTPV